MNDSKIIDFLKEVGKLKSTLRFQESPNMPKDTTAGHSWRTALMSFMIADELKLNLDLNKVMKMAIIHDIVEAKTGNTDYTAIASGKISKKEQNELEDKAIKQLSQILPEKTGEEIFNLWTEFNQGETKESKYVKAINKLETLIYLLEVGHNHFSGPELIFDYIKNANEIPELEGTFNAVREELEKETAKVKQD